MVNVNLVKMYKKFNFSVHLLMVVTKFEKNLLLRILTKPKNVNNFSNRDFALMVIGVNLSTIKKSNFFFNF